MQHIFGHELDDHYGRLQNKSNQDRMPDHKDQKTLKTTPITADEYLRKRYKNQHITDGIQIQQNSGPFCKGL